jgi:hypothetical protein
MPIDAEAVVAILQKFRIDAEQALNELRNSNINAEIIEGLRKIYAQHETDLQKMIMDLPSRDCAS